MLRDELTFDRVPFSSTKRGALFFSGGGSKSLRHRQQKRLWRRPLLRGFFEGETWTATGRAREDETLSIMLKLYQHDRDAQEVA